MSSERKLEPDGLARETRFRRQRSLRRIVQLFADDVRLDLDPPVHVPVHAEGRDLVGVAEDYVGARTRRSRLARGAAPELEVFDAPRDFDRAESKTREERLLRLVDAVGLPLPRDRIGTAHGPALPDDRRQIRGRDAFTAALGLGAHPFGLDRRGALAGL